MQHLLAGIRKKSGLREFEFVALMAFLMSNVALAIDSVLPALPDIGRSLQVSGSNDLQLIIFMIFLGLGMGELVFGALSDSFGRKPIVRIGVGIYILASFFIIWAQSLEVLLLGRVLQGVGLSAARSVSISIIRDTYDGDRMARIMSFIMSIFILVPMVAPLLGQIILESSHWRAIFYAQILFIGVIITWFSMRQGETHPKEKRIAFSRYLFINGLKAYFRQRSTVVYSLVSGLVHGAFIAYLGSAQQIFQGQYRMIAEFPYIFGGLAFSFGLSTLLNGSLVMKFGMMKLVNSSLLLSIASSLAYLLFFAKGANPGLVMLIGFLLLQFFSLGFILGNLSALAMHPIGHIAGVGAAIFSFMTMSLGVFVAITVGAFIQDTAVPLFAGFAFSSVLGMVLIWSLRPKSQ